MRKHYFILLLLFWANLGSAEHNLPSDFEFGQIAILSDGDVYAQSYLGDPLPPYADQRFQDKLTLLSANGSSDTIEVSNSVVGTPEVMDIGKSKDLIVVVETREQRKRNDKVISDLKAGRNIAILTKKESSWHREKFKLNFTPNSVSINSQETLIAIGGQLNDRGYIQLYAKNGTSWLKGQTHWTEGTDHPAHISLVQWHPSKNQLAVHYFRRNVIKFFNVDQEQFISWGSIEVGPDPFVGRYINEGNYYLTANWGRNFATSNVFDRLPKNFSSLSIVKLGRRKPDHEVIQKTQITRSPEGIAVSRDGLKIAIASMQDSLYSLKRANFKSTGMLSFLTFDPAKERVSIVGKVSFNGILPEGIDFDLSGNYIIAPVFQINNEMNAETALKIFSISNYMEDGIREIGYLPVPHGAHHVIVK